MTIEPAGLPSTVLVEVEDCPGVALVVGSGCLDGVELIRPTLFPATAAANASGTISTLAGIGNVAAQAGQAASGLAGLVRLTPETLQALQTAAPVTNAAGANLGTLVDASGKFAHSVQWVPAGAAGAVQVAASLGPAIALLMIQVQLNEISSLVKENIALTDEVLKTVRNEHWARVAGLHEAMMTSIEEAQHAGSVTAHIWENVIGHEPELRQARIEFASALSQHIAALGARKGPRERAEFLTHHAGAIISDAQAVIRAQAAWFTYQAIRAGRVYADPNEPDSLLTRIIENAKSEQESTFRQVDRLLHELHWQFSLMADLPGKRTIKLSKSGRSARQVADTAKILVDQVAALREASGQEVRPIPAPKIVAFADDPPDFLPRVLRWHLADSERLLAVADTKVRGSGRHFLAVTDRRLLDLEEGDFQRYGEVERTVDLDSIRYVRFRSAQLKSNGQLDVVTPEGDLSFEFKTWAARDDDSDRVQDFADLVRSSMNLPASEVPASPLQSASGPAAINRRRFDAN